MKLLKQKGPLYIQVKDILKERIVTGIYPVRSLMPAETQLEEEFHVSKITIRKAVEQLTQEGYVKKQSGIGTTVLDNRAVIKLSTGQNFSAYLQQEGKSVRKEVLQVKKVDPPDEVKRLRSGPFSCIERLYYLDNEPYIYFFHYIPSDYPLPTDLSRYEDSLYTVLSEVGVTFNRFQDAFSVATPHECVRNHLQVEPLPMLRRTRHAFDLDEVLVEYSIAYYRTELQDYVIPFDV
ncbi:GntR family transcriptional regulator [Alkalihalobacillus sp. LMS6]|uniref:GntR family transcriptional regulator n=1 Tax=Alkalihalobacillus sp. LMS6 TaxID=2924034 RepID=UPI0020D05598|nr:GntR family transcriptional regulator [Alkalihalobacillus sp. LMS6]UTR08233.1 GntR family transcriptional regulator [Alkalihalobacillus sp. LMS6]